MRGGILKTLWDIPCTTIEEFALLMEQHIACVHVDRVTPLFELHAQEPGQLQRHSAPHDHGVLIGSRLTRLLRQRLGPDCA